MPEARSQPIEFQAQDLLDFLHQGWLTVLLSRAERGIGDE